MVLLDIKGPPAGCAVPPSQLSLDADELEFRLPDEALLETEPPSDGYLELRLVVVFMAADENAEEDEGFLSFTFPTPFEVSRSQATFCLI